MMRAEWYLTTRFCANSIPLPPRGHEIAVEARADPWRMLAGGSDGCFPGSSARASCLTSCTPGWGRVWDGALPGLADNRPAVDWQPGVCVLEVAIEHDG
jgi:hypothetical protein